MVLPLVVDLFLQTTTFNIETKKPKEENKFQRKIKEMMDKAEIDKIKK